MLIPRSLLVLLAAALSLLTLRPAPARAEVSFDFFYETLAPHGEWLRVADYGYCWRPNVDEEWTPYSDGYWAFTDAGWTWVSYEEFGGIVYHYGRWVRVEDEGWCWVPDYEWGPAWVSWRQSEEHVGWAPLPPEARWQPSIGISIWADREYDIGPGYYNFCRVRDFGAPVLRPVLINRVENVTIIRRTVNCTNITYNTHYERPVIYNGGLDFDSINRRSSRQVPALKLVQRINFDPEARDRGGRNERRDGDRHRGAFHAEAVGNQLIVAAPQVRPMVDSEEMRARAKRVVAADRVTRGWSGNEEVRHAMRQEIGRQARGLNPESAPARTVAVSELKALPERGNPEAPSPVATRERRNARDAHEASEKSHLPPGTNAGNPEAAAAERMTRERTRGETTQERKSGSGEPALAPFNPNRGENAPPHNTAVGAPRRSGVAAETPASRTRERAAAQGEQAAEQARMQAEQERATRQRSEATAMQRQQHGEAQARAAQEAGRQAERMRVQEESARRAQKGEEEQRNQAREQQMRRANEQQQQQQQHEAARQQQMRRQAEQQQQGEAARQQPQMRRPNEPQQERGEGARRQGEHQQQPPPPQRGGEGEGQRRGQPPAPQQQMSEEERNRLNKGGGR